MNTTITPPDTFLTAKEVKGKIAACIGSSGEHLFRKWTEGSSPVLPRHYFRNCARPYYSLTKVDALLVPGTQPTL